MCIKNLILNSYGICLTLLLTVYFLIVTICKHDNTAKHHTDPMSQTLRWPLPVEEDPREPT